MAETRLVECAQCGIKFRKAIKRINQSEKLGQHHTCSRKCSSLLTNNPRQCEPATEKAAQIRHDKAKHPDHHRARWLVKQAIRSGKFKPPIECELCGITDRVEGHHPDHSRPFFLLYVCKEHHIMADSDPYKCGNLATDYSDEVGYNNNGGE